MTSIVTILFLDQNICTLFVLVNSQEKHILMLLDPIYYKYDDAHAQKQHNQTL